jgi:hypothetical protein
MRLYEGMKKATKNASIALDTSLSIDASKQNGDITLIITPEATATFQVFAVIGAAEVEIASGSAKALFTLSNNVDSYRIASAVAANVVDYVITEYSI